MAVSPTKFQDFVGHLGLGYHGNLNSNTINVALFQAAAAPSASGDSVYADLTNEVANGNGYTTGGQDVVNTFSETGGTATLSGQTDTVWTASGGTIPNIRYPVLYNTNSTTALNALIFYYDYGSEITLQDTETFTFTISTNLFTMT